MGTSAARGIDRRVAALGLACAGLALVLMGLRAGFTLVTPEPTQALTSGAEYESLYVLWKLVHGLPAYADQKQIPFAGTYYNWLYYAVYAVPARLAAGLGEAWIPTATKLTSLGFVLGGLSLSWRLSARILGPVSPTLRATAAAVWVLVFLGPLMGFWAMATAPDMGALFFDSAGVLAFILLYERRPRAAVAVFMVLAYAAWGFKQVFVYSTGAVGLFLLSRRDWWGAALLGLGTVAAWAATLALGPSDFVRMVFFGGTQIVLAPERLARNLGNFAIKCAPLLATLVVVAALAPGWRTLWRRPEIAVPALGVMVAGLLSGAASAKLGASENYYFTLSFHLALLLLAGLAELERRGRIPALAQIALAGGWALTAAALAATLLGFGGLVSPRKFHDSLVADARCIGTQPGPVFVANPYLALPWMVPSTPAFVLHWNYPLDRAAGVAMEGGGVGGLIAGGYFGTVVLNEEQAAFDGAALAPHYRLERRCSGYAIYRRQEGLQ